MAPQNTKSHRIQRNKKRIIMINIKPRKQFADTVLNLGKKNNKIVVLVSDISHGIFKPFAKLFKKLSLYSVIKTNLFFNKNFSEMRLRLAIVSSVLPDLETTTIQEFL